MAFKLNSKGFTLIEVMIAITLLSLLMISIFSITDSSITTKDEVTREDREYLQVQTALHRLEMDLSQIYSPLYFSFPRISPNTPGVTADMFDEDNPPPRYRASEKYPLESHHKLPIPVMENENAQELVFMTTSNRRKTYDSKQSRYGWVRYYLEAYVPDDPEEEVHPERQGSQQLMRAFEAYNPYKREFEWDKARSYALLKAIKDFKFEFWDRQNERYVDLLRNVPKDNQSPRLIRVSFTWIDSEGLAHPFERVFRPLYPFFDRDQDLAIHLKVMRESVQARRQAQGGGAPRPEEQEGDGFPPGDFE